MNPGVQFNRHLKFKAWVKAWVKDKVGDAFRKALDREMVKAWVKARPVVLLHVLLPGDLPVAVVVLGLEDFPEAL